MMKEILNNPLKRKAGGKVASEGSLKVWCTHAYLTNEKLDHM